MTPATLSYRNLEAEVVHDAEDGIFVGRLLGVRDVVGFHAERFDEVEHAFRETVDDYLATLVKLGR
jgi:predicted HicB family RNase H-like nuclease